MLGLFLLREERWHLTLGGDVMGIKFFKSVQEAVANEFTVDSIYPDSEGNLTCTRSRNGLKERAVILMKRIA